MKTYAKGVLFEREMLHFLNYKGFSCMRQASSGGFITPADIVAMKKGLILGIECKNHKTKPRLVPKKLRKFKEWCERAGAIGLLAWRAPGNKWLFLRIEDAENNRYDDDNWLDIEGVLRVFDFR